LAFGGEAAVPLLLELDWVVVRVVTLRRVLAIAATGVVAAALVFFAYLRLNLPPDVRARRAIEHAERSRERLGSQPLPDAWKTELQQAEAQLDTARTAYAAEGWVEALSHAEGARSRFEALAGVDARTVVGVGHFFSLNGKVSVQRAGKAEWSNAQPRNPVFNGDFVRTGRDGSAEILFSDGSLYRIAPNSLLEIHHEPSASSPSAVKMIVGQINVHTSDAGSTVTTNTSETLVQRDSRVAVDVDQDEKETRVATLSGSARVRGGAGAEVVVGSREQVAAHTDGSLSDKRRLPNPPLPLEPQNNAGFDLQGNPVITLRWRRSTEQGTIHLQVCRSPSFLSDQLDVDAPSVVRDYGRLKVVAAGTYYWRVATISGPALRSEWSPTRRFRVYQPNRQQLLDDRTPPKLDLQPVQQLGQVFIVEGQTEVGATVTINDEEVGLDHEGRFRKTMEATKVGWNEVDVVVTDPSGNTAEQKRRLYVEVY
jgi:hypothetical protein